MSNRAQLSKLPSWVDTSPPGAKFLGSGDFPPGLVKAVELHDPAGVLLGQLDRSLHEVSDRTPSAVEQARLLPLMKRFLQSKRILNLSGGADRLVPYKCGEAFIEWLKSAAAPGGWFADKFHIEDLVFDGVGHEMSTGMVVETIRFIAQTLNAHLNAPAATAAKM
ncbi:MAG: hypothetical protein Q9225_003996 [Loekoesia sp. 1 TL-2023]